MNTWKHLIITFFVIILPALLGGVLMDIPDHYRSNLSLKENIKFMIGVGLGGQQTRNMTRSDYTYNIFHRPQIMYYILIFVMVFAMALLIHWCCDMLWA
jgi:K+-transporting ATPase A subunit